MREVYASAVTRHPDYSKGVNPELINDLAIIQLTQNESLELLPLSMLNPTDNSNVSVAGWGASEHDAFLQEVEIRVHNLESCAVKNNQSLQETNHLCGSSQGVSGSCQGDSGGPMVLNYPLYDVLKNAGIPDDQISSFRRPVLVGVVSYGIDQCSSEQHPEIYAQAKNARDLIRIGGGIVNSNTTNLRAFFSP